MRSLAGRALRHAGDSRWPAVALPVLAWGLAACGGNGTLNAGWDVPHGLLPVDERSPFVIVNDGYYDNWQGEYALLLGNSGAPLVGIIVTAPRQSWPNIDENLAGWRAMVAAARASGMKSAPDPIASTGAPLAPPADGTIDSTQPNGSPGAYFILDASRRYGARYRPLVIAVGTSLTDVADAYLLDHTVTERVVVVASVGTWSGDGGTMGFPNGDMDSWADLIVAKKFRYVQVSAFYDQTMDVPSSSLSKLPNDPFGAWIASKQSKVFNSATASDQVSVLASAMPSFVLAVEQGSVKNWAAVSNVEPTLGADPSGNIWIVTDSAGSLASAGFWRMLRDPNAFGP